MKFVGYAGDSSLEKTEQGLADRYLTASIDDRSKRKSFKKAVVLHYFRKFVNF
jgi:hypothetical protein